MSVQEAKMIIADRLFWSVEAVESLSEKHILSIGRFLAHSR
jgi:hypothetical protein